MHPIALIREEPYSPLFPLSFRFVRRYSPVVQQAALVGLNTFFFISKLDKDIPDRLSQSTLALLSGMGLISAPYTLDLAYKCAQDFHFARRNKSPFIALLSFFRVVNQLNTVALIILNLTASLFGAFGDETTENALFERMIPWSEGLLLLGMCLLVTDIVIAKKAKDAVENPELDLRARAALIRSSMDKDTLWQLQSLEDFSIEKGSEVIVRNLDTQLKITHGGRALLTTVGFLLLAVEKWATPNSAISGGINTATALLWSVQISLEKWREMRQRHDLEACQNHVALVEVEQDARPILQASADFSQ